MFSPCATTLDTARRYVCRKKVLSRVLIVTLICYSTILFLTTVAMTSMSELETLAGRMKYGGRNDTTRTTAKECVDLPLKFYNNRYYTDELLARSNFTLVKNNGNKNFMEYAIPAPSTLVAYEPDLAELSIMVIPFSHVDPGYGMTFENYYMTRSRHTLTHMVQKLHQYPDLTFQWAETVFLDRWWQEANETMRVGMRQLVSSGRLDVVLGGWVMPDESVTHYAAVIDQMIEGHTWLREHLNMTPSTAWVNDPFGYSATFPYLLRKSGIQNLAILRIHQALKSTLMLKRSLEFRWKQMWDDSAGSDVLCHLMPYRGYWIGDTCGPNNQHICREYAFMHLNPVDKVVFLTDENLPERARILYEQYRITAELFRKFDKKNSTLKEKLYLPMFLGEDFSFVTPRDFDLIYTNYKKLFEYMNNKKEWKMDIKFGTLSKYFARMTHYHNNNTGYEFPSLSGDFFPYSDYQNDYWTGYFTTRPFVKRFSRHLQNRLKVVDVFYTYAQMRIPRFDLERTTEQQITEARRKLAIFQHHDGITGTSLYNVMQDFRRQLFDAYVICERVLRKIIPTLISTDRVSTSMIKDVTSVKSPESLPIHALLTVPPNGAYLVVANPLPRQRHSAVTFHSSDANVAVRNNNNQRLKTQIRPLPDGRHEVTFNAHVEAASVNFFNVTLAQHASQVQMYDSNDTQDDILLENDALKVVFSRKTGLVSRIESVFDRRLNVSVEGELLAYTAKRSGAYIFAPIGHATPLFSHHPLMNIVKGPVYSEVTTTFEPGCQVITRLYNSPDINGKAVFISTQLDMGKLANSMDKEIILRFKTDIPSNGTFFTDSNSFQLLKRTTRPARDVEENYFPMTSQALVEGGGHRLTLHAGQPHGTASLNSGWLEV